MRKPVQPETTTRRCGLEATVPCYLREVTVDEHGFITDFAIAFLPDDVNPDEIKGALRDALNLDEPEHCRIYDAEDRYLAGHPGTPLPLGIVARLRRTRRGLVARLRTRHRVLLSFERDETSPGGLQMRYAGPPFAVDAERLEAWILSSNPSLPDAADSDCETDVLALWRGACRAGAVIVPQCVTAEMFTSADLDGTTFTFVVYPVGGPSVRGVTAGWRVAEAIAAPDGAAANAPDLIRAAVGVFVVELNDALGLPGR